MNLVLSDTTPVKFDGDSQRKKLLLQNQDSAAKVAISFSDPAVTIGSSNDHDGHVIEPGDARLFSGEDAKGPIWVISDTNGAKLNIDVGF